MSVIPTENTIHVTVLIVRNAEQSRRMILMQKHRIIFRVTDQEYQQIISEATRENMTVSDYIRNKLKKTKKRLDNLPPAAYMEAQKLIGMYQDVLKRLEGF